MELKVIQTGQTWFPMKQQMSDVRCLKVSDGKDYPPLSRKMCVIKHIHEAPAWKA
jgi:hypothetical protein